MKDAPWTEAEKAYAAKNWALGYTYTQIARELKRSRSSVAGALRRMRLQVERPCKEKPRDDGKPLPGMRRIDHVAELLAEGFALTDISDELGISRKAVVSCLKRIRRELGWQAQ